MERLLKFLSLPKEKDMAEFMVDIRKSQKMRSLGSGCHNQVHAGIRPVVVETTGNAKRRIIRVSNLFAHPMDQETHHGVFVQETLKCDHWPPLPSAHQF